MAIGAAIGYLVTRFLARPGATAALDDSFVTSADGLVATPPPDDLATPAPEAQPAPAPSTEAAAAVTEPVTDPVTEPVAASPAQPAPPVEPVADQAVGATTLELADRIRATLEADPRTTHLPALSINVADTTVFVRGVVPPSTDASVVREVIAAVPGVDDVDLQVTAAT